MVKKDIDNDHLDANPDDGDEVKESVDTTGAHVEVTVQQQTTAQQSLYTCMVVLREFESAVLSWVDDHKAK